MQKKILTRNLAEFPAVQQVLRTMFSRRDGGSSEVESASGVSMKDQILGSGRQDSRDSTLKSPLVRATGAGAPHWEWRGTHADYSRVSISPLMRMTVFASAVRDLVTEDPSVVHESMRIASMRDQLRLHRWSLFLTIYCSILEGSFLSYVQSSSSLYIASVLYFTRLFSDLLGRWLALFPKPSVFSTIDQVYFASWIRVSATVFFFAYVIIPEPYFFRSDPFIIAFQVRSARDKTLCV